MVVLMVCCFDGCELLSLPMSCLWLANWASHLCRKGGVGM
jgi:hypothetical protein